MGEPAIVSWVLGGVGTIATAIAGWHLRRLADRLEKVERHETWLVDLRARAENTATASAVESRLGEAASDRRSIEAKTEKLITTVANKVDDQATRLARLEGAFGAGRK